MKNSKSELPTTEVVFKYTHRTFEAAWQYGVSRLIRVSQDRAEETQI